MFYTCATISRAWVGVVVVGVREGEMIEGRFLYREEARLVVRFL